MPVQPLSSSWEPLAHSAVGRWVDGWGGLLPALMLCAYFGVGLIAYAVRHALVGPYRDPEVESRGSSLLVGMWLRMYFVWVTRPIWRVVRSTGVPATAVTTLSVILALAAAAAVAAGRFAVGGWLYLASGFCDFLDGRLARETGTSGPAGAVLDSVLDRYADAAILIGLAWYFRGTWVLLPTLLALVGTLMVPYVRARGEGLGATVKAGLMQRPERVVYLGLSVAMSPVAERLVQQDLQPAAHHLAVGGILLVAVLTQLTSAQRLARLLKALSLRSLGDSGGRTGLVFAKYVTSASLATAVDFAVVVTLVTASQSPPWLATGLGCAVGGGLNYTLNRLWTFRSRGDPLPQGARYTFVSATSAGLNAGGVAVMLLMPELDYRIAWLVVRGTVFLAWNYPLQRSYVFETGPNAPAPPPRRVKASGPTE